MDREFIRMKAEGINTNKIRSACDYIFDYLNKERFSLLETEHLISSMGLIVNDMVKNDPLRKLEDFSYSASAESLFSFVAASNTKS